MTQPRATEPDPSNWVTFKFEGMSESGKTRKWWVLGSGGENDFIGVIAWSGQWRKYAFASDRAVYDPACLRDIAAWLDWQTQLHYDELRLARKEAV